MADRFSNAEGYERQMGARSAALAPRFIEFAGVEEGDRVLDVGAGTGPLALALARLKSCSEIVGIDPSPPFIEFARTRTGDSRVRFEVGDAMNLPYPDRYFDKTLSQLVLNQVPDAPVAVKEMRRVTKPGGVVAACVWASGKGSEFNRKFWQAAIAVDPSAAEQRKTGGSYGRKARLSALWTDCGIKDIQTADLAISVAFASFDEFWQPHLEGQARAGSYVKSLPPQRQAKLRERLRRDILGTEPDGRFSLRAQAVAVKGVC